MTETPKARKSPPSRITCDNRFDSVEVERRDEARDMAEPWRVTIHTEGEPNGYGAWHDGSTFEDARQEAIARCRGWLRALRKLRAGSVR